jgi:hypothetical protein
MAVTAAVIDKVTVKDLFISLLFLLARGALAKGINLRIPSRGGK